MAACDTCGAKILFGGIREEYFRFCSAACRDHATPLLQASQLPDEVIQAEALRLRDADCPLCKGAGPLDVYVVHWIWSAIAVTRWGSERFLCCKTCGQNKQVKNFLFSFVLGWWGFPFGLFLTPYQLAMNIKDTLTRQHPNALSKPLWKRALTELANRAP